MRIAPAKIKMTAKPITKIAHGLIAKSTFEPCDMSSMPITTRTNAKRRVLKESLSLMLTKPP